LILPSEGSSKKTTRELSSTDRAWLVSHMDHSPEAIDKLFKDFNVEYKNGGIFRKWATQHAVQCSAVQCSAVQCSVVQCSAVQCHRSVPQQHALILY
jgi:hypothetical protein